MHHSNRFLTLVQGILSSIQEVDAMTLQDQINKGERFLLIDVREQDEWTTGHIPTAVHLGKGIIERDIEKRAPDADLPIVLYCGGGYRSALAAHALQQMGYTDVLSLAGGMRAWREGDFEVAFCDKA